LTAGCYFEAPAAREAMPAKRVVLVADAVLAAVERTHDGKQQWRSAIPVLRVAVPQQVAARAIAQHRQLCTLRVDRGAELRRAQGDPVGR
jgi:hypothetical protein